MHGLIFVTWERFLEAQFGTELLRKYRSTIGETPATAPLANQVYDDAKLLVGVSTAQKLTGVAVDTLLYQYGYYYLLNGLTSHRCKYLLQRVSSGRDLLLTMRDAHAQMRNTPDGLTPPVFQYRPLSHQYGLHLIYDSPRHLCPLLIGSIEGAAARYNERVSITEKTCMRHGADICSFDVIFTPPLKRVPETVEQREKRDKQYQATQSVLAVLPSREQEAMAWPEIQNVLQQDGVIIRSAHLMAAINELYHAGYIAGTADQINGVPTLKRYWKVIGYHNK